MGHNDDNHFKSAHAATPGKGYGNENDDGRSNEKRRNNVGNDEGWLSAFLGMFPTSVIARPTSRCHTRAKRQPLMTCSSSLEPSAAQSLHQVSVGAFARLATGVFSAMDAEH